VSIIDHIGIDSNGGHRMLMKVIATVIASHPRSLAAVERIENGDAFGASYFLTSFAATVSVAERSNMAGGAEASLRRCHP
jgi:hypothetical protein